MGYNKVIFCLNDAQHEADEDPAGWWQACKEAFGSMWRNPGKPQSFSLNGAIHGWQAVWEQHADVTGVIFVGGNHATIFGGTNNGGLHSKEEDQIKILKEILRSKGYEIRKKRK